MPLPQLHLLLSPAHLLQDSSPPWPTLPRAQPISTNGALGVSLLQELTSLEWGQGELQVREWRHMAAW